MTRERIVPFGGLAFVVAAALMLLTIISRSPDTHGHIWPALPADYARTPLDTIGESNLQAILADLPPFTFPAPSGARRAEQTAGSAEAKGQPASATAAGSAVEEIQKATLNQSEFAISPGRLTLKVGVPVELTVINEGKQVHGLWMPDFGISEDIRSGKTEVFRFTPDKPGRFRYTCSYNLCGTEEEHARMVGFVTVR